MSMADMVAAILVVLIAMNIRIPLVAALISVSVMRMMEVVFVHQLGRRLQTHKENGHHQDC